jgi:hypothetical protein
METVKVCTKCKVEKSTTEFTRRKYVYKDVERWGYKAWCKPCHNLDGKLVRDANVEQARVRERELRAQRMARMTAEEREALNAKHREWDKDWRKKNPERVKELKRKDREIHRESIAAKKAADRKTEHGRALEKARVQRYHAAHPERVRMLHRAASAKRAPIAKIEARQKRIDLEKSYIAQLLCLPTAVVPPELVEAERARLKLKRVLQELNKYRTEKKCSTCQTYHPILSFPKSVKSKDGHGYVCFVCRRERKKEGSVSKDHIHTARNI